MFLHKVSQRAFLYTVYFVTKCLPSHSTFFHIVSSFGQHLCTVSAFIFFYTVSFLAKCLSVHSIFLQVVHVFSCVRYLTLYSIFLCRVSSFAQYLRLHSIFLYARSTWSSSLPLVACWTQESRVERLILLFCKFH